ncbi:lysis protein [Enterobacter bugandensis]|uniref:lysis protein n=1 Tax=Enterobacter bugandensis TaxID=881260 RepID=UPI0020048BC9|nr:lysis protein [Enterobacter bugandensis]MCK6810616.1 lysis protein [Enterobacter bugandensis]
MTARAWIVILIELLLSGLIIAILYTSASNQKKRAEDAEQKLALATATISDMQTRQRDVATLDAKYTQELSDAQETINQLERDVATGKRRLQLNATCKGNSSGTTGVDDATSPRLTDSAERDYFTLRQRIETVTKQLTGLQEYVKTQCLR